MIFYKQWQRPRAISFDLDDTLYDNVPIMARAEQAAQIWLAEQCEAFASWSIADWANYRHQSALLAPNMADDMTALRLFSLMRAFREQGYEKSKARQLADEGFHQFWHHRNDFQAPTSSRQLLEELAARYPIIAITNGNADPERIGLGGLFNHVLHPQLDRYRAKPSADLFRLAESLLKIPGHQCLHVGDHLNTDINGALQASWQAAWLNHEHQAIPDCKPTATLPQVELGRIDELRQLLL